MSVVVPEDAARAKLEHMIAAEMDRANGWPRQAASTLIKNAGFGDDGALIAELMRCLYEGGPRAAADYLWDFGVRPEVDQ